MAVIGYRTGVIQAVVSALRSVWPESIEFAEYKLDKVKVDIEYPIEEKLYPYVQVGYSEDSVKPASLDGFMIDEQAVPAGMYQRWMFSGDISFALFSLRAYQRDLLSDGLFASVGASESFADALKANTYVQIDANTKDISIGPKSETPGTPWDSDDIVYYAEYSVKVQGEFVTSTEGGGVIERVRFYPRLEGEPDIPDNTEGGWV